MKIKSLILKNNTKTYYELINDYAKDFITYYKKEIEEIIKKNKDLKPDDIFKAIQDGWGLNEKMQEWFASWYLYLRIEELIRDKIKKMIKN